MLESLNLSGAPAFNPDSVTKIGPLKSVNFVFGPNGSGKTTVSRAFADPSRFAGTAMAWRVPTRQMGIRVYNRDYVNETLKQAAHLPGVFLLGKASAEVQAEIDGLGGAAGKIANGQKRLDDLAESLSKKVAEISVLRDALKESAWAARASVPDDLRAMFAGYNHSKEALLVRVLEIADTNSEASDTFDALESEAAAVMNDDVEAVSELRRGRPLPMEAMAAFELFSVPVLGSADVGLADLIEDLQNADWVQHGQHYLDNSMGLCPFCQQAVPADLSEQLNLYFDKRYLRQLEDLRSLKSDVLFWLSEWRLHLDDLGRVSLDSDHLDPAKLEVARLQFEVDTGKLLDEIDAKIDGPSTTIALTSPNAAVGSINELIDTANQSIAAFNLRVNNRATVRKTLLKRAWVAFVRTMLATEVGRFEGAIPALLRGRDGIERALETGTSDLKSKRARMRELQAQVTSSKPIIDTMNRLLESVGFHNFRLKESPAVVDGYSIERETGAVDSETLSEGERTFITFLYFAQSLQGAPKDSGELDDLLAVVDDPISSLDSDVLYAVSALVRRIVADISAGHGRVRQIVLLTHNAHFHREVTYRRHGDKDGDWQYGVVRKKRGEWSTVDMLATNPIQTAYGSLWAEIRRSTDDVFASAVGIQNIMRRILETYFNVLGGVDDSAIMSKFTGEDLAICRLLFSWVNAGSHSIFDDLDYAPTNSSVEMYLRIFRQVFVEHGQEGHFMMMMAEPRRPEVQQPE